MIPLMIVWFTFEYMLHILNIFGSILFLYFDVNHERFQKDSVEGVMTCVDVLHQEVL